MVSIAVHVKMARNSHTVRRMRVGMGSPYTATGKLALVDMDDVGTGV